MADCHEDVKKRIEALYNMLVEHEGYGEMQIDFKILKKGQKEVIIHCGKHAAEKIRYIDKVKHHILISSHPSPLSAYRGFFGSNHFSRTNNFLIEKNIKPINWNL